MTADGASGTAMGARGGEVVGAANGRGRKKRLVLGAVVTAGAVLTALYVASTRGRESTDDAQVDAELVALAPRTSGVVTKVVFDDNQHVKAGDLLAELDDAPARARLAQAEANLSAALATAEAADAEAHLAETTARANRTVASASLEAASAGAVSSRDQITEAEARVQAARAALAQATNDRDRTLRLVETGALSQAQLDQARTAFDTATASLAQANAHLASLRGAATQAASHVHEASAKADQAKQVDVYIAQAQARAKGAHAQVDQLRAARDLAALDLSYTRIFAPQGGIVSKKNVSVGQTLTAGAPVAQLVPDGRIWVTANFKETQIGAMRVGQPVTIEVDAFSHLKLHGEVESFSGATGSRFALLPPDNATGNFTKIVQRVPVRVRVKDLPPSLALRPGMNVELTVDTRK